MLRVRDCLENSRDERLLFLIDAWRRMSDRQRNALLMVVEALEGS